MQREEKTQKDKTRFGDSPKKIKEIPKDAKQEKPFAGVHQQICRKIKPKKAKNQCDRGN